MTIKLRTLTKRAQSLASLPSRKRAATEKLQLSPVSPDFGSPNVASVESTQSIIDAECLNLTDNPEEWDKLLPETLARPTFASKIEVKSICLLYNPFSGAKQGQKLADLSKQAFENNGITVRMVKLEHRGHAEELLANMNTGPFDVICVLGGDGTFHEAVNGYMKRKDLSRLYVPLAVLPGGTGNSMALELWNSTKMKNALEHAMRGLTAPIDVGEIYFPLDDKKMYSVNSLHWGLASSVNITAEKLRWMGKSLRYGTASLMEMLKRRRRQLATIEAVDINGKRSLVTEQYVLGMANNIRTAAKGMKIAPQAKLNDGLIDILLVKSDKLVDLARIGRRFFDGTHVSLDCVDYRQVREFSMVPFLDAEVGDDFANLSPSLLDVDGELTGSTPFKCKIHQQSLRIVV